MGDREIEREKPRERGEMYIHTVYILRERVTLKDIKSITDG